MSTAMNKIDILRKYKAIIKKMADFEESMKKVLAHPDATEQQVIQVVHQWRDIMTKRQIVENMINSKWGNTVKDGKIVSVHSSYSSFLN
jgi:hypothetical protein